MLAILRLVFFIFIVFSAHHYTVSVKENLFYFFGTGRTGKNCLAEKNIYVLFLKKGLIAT